MTYLDQAVSAVDQIKSTASRGDILVFMPTESDIRETVQRLDDRKYLHTLVLPLFGRMAAWIRKGSFKPAARTRLWSPPMSPKLRSPFPASGMWLTPDWPASPIQCPVPDPDPADPARIPG